MINLDQTFANLEAGTILFPVDQFPSENSLYFSVKQNGLIICSTISTPVLNNGITFITEQAVKYISVALEPSDFSRAVSLDATYILVDCSGIAPVTLFGGNFTLGAINPPLTSPAPVQLCETTVEGDAYTTFEFPYGSVILAVAALCTEADILNFSVMLADKATTVATLENYSKGILTTIPIVTGSFVLNEAQKLWITAAEVFYNTVTVRIYFI